MAVTEKSAANRTASPSGSAASDNENSERPVREQLKKTSIDPPKAGTSQDDSEPRRKRSREEVDKDTEEESRNVTAAGRHSRKRSRDVDHDSSEDMSTAEKSDASSDVGIRPTTPSRMDLSAEEVEAEKVTSPKGKRNREQFLKDSDDGNTQSLNGATVAPIVDEKAKDQTLSGLKDDGRDAKRHRDDIAKAATGSKVSGEKADAVKIPPGSGFANVSASSPFANLGGTKTAEPKAEASKSAFESSGFSKLAQSSTSPFASIGSSGGTSSPFGNFGSAFKSPPAETTSKPTEAATKSGFGALGGSALGAPSGFGGFASSNPFTSALSAKPGPSAFGSASPFGGAAGKPGIIGLSSKPAKPFGAPQSDSDSEEGEDGSSDGGEDGEDTSKDASKEEESKKEKRPQEIDWETGEEGEHTVSSARAKLYVFDAGTWKERGTGTLKLNISKRDSDPVDDEEEQDDPEEKTSDDTEAKPPRKARFILRADGSHRLVLNTPFSKTMSFGGDSTGTKPTGSALLFTGFLEGQDKMSMLQVKMKPGMVLQMWEAAEDIRKVI